MFDFDKIETLVKNKSKGNYNDLEKRLQQFIKDRKDQNEDETLHDTRQSMFQQIKENLVVKINQEMSRTDRKNSNDKNIDNLSKSQVFLTQAQLQQKIVFKAIKKQSSKMCTHKRSKQYEFKKNLEIFKHQSTYYESEHLFEKLNVLFREELELDDDGLPMNFDILNYSLADPQFNKGKINKSKIRAIRQKVEDRREEYKTQVEINTKNDDLKKHKSKINQIMDHNFDESGRKRVNSDGTVKEMRFSINELRMLMVGLDPNHSIISPKTHKKGENNQSINSASSYDFISENELVTTADIPNKEILVKQFEKNRFGKIITKFHDDESYTLDENYTGASYDIGLENVVTKELQKRIIIRAEDNKNMIKKYRSENGQYMQQYREMFKKKFKDKRSSQKQISEQKGYFDDYQNIANHIHMQVKKNLEHKLQSGHLHGSSKVNELQDMANEAMARFEAEQNKHEKFVKKKMEKVKKLENSINSPFAGNILQKSQGIDVCDTSNVEQNSNNSRHRFMSDSESVPGNHQKSHSQLPKQEKEGFSIDISLGDDGARTQSKSGGCFLPKIIGSKSKVSPRGDRVRTLGNEQSSATKTAKSSRVRQPNLSVTRLDKAGYDETGVNNQNTVILFFVLKNFRKRVF